MKRLLTCVLKNIIPMMCVFCLSCVFVVPTVFAEEAIDKAYQVKAAYLYNILKFVDWPESKINLPLVLCIYGVNPFGNLLQNLESRTVANRHIKIKYIQTSSASSCDVIYINSQSDEVTKKAISIFDGKGILTVGDNPKFTDFGGVVGFVEKDGTIRFKLNMTRAKALGVMINSQLTEMAVEIQ